MARDMAAVTPRRDIVSLLDRVHTSLHCTQAQSNANYDSRVSGPASKPWLQRGRPGLQHEFARMREAMDKETVKGKQALHHYAVLVCGPEQLVNEVRLLCAKQSSSTIRLVLHEESFIW